jgi:hypothetical protein
MKETYVIEYDVYFLDGHSEGHKTKVKNCLSDLQAKIRLEGHLRKKYPDFKSLVVSKCNKDVFGGLFDMFGKNNPFGF